MATRKVQHLTLEGVKVKAREAYDKKRLTAQHPDPHQRECVFTGRGPTPRDKQYHCVIGAALEPRTLRHVKVAGSNAESLISLVHKKIVTVDDGEIDELCYIQRQHDSWAQAAQAYPRQVNWRHTAFLQAIGHPSAPPVEKVEG